MSEFKHFEKLKRTTKELAGAYDIKTYKKSRFSYLSTKFTEELAVLTNFHLLNLLPQTGTITGT